MRQPEVKRELRRLGERAKQDQHQRERIPRVGANLLAGAQDHIEGIAADDLAEQDDAAEQAQAPHAGHGQRHARALPRIGALVPESDQQERRHAGQFPEHDHQDQVVGQHDAEHGSHESEQECVESRGRIFGRQVVARIQHDECANPEDHQRERPRKTIHAKAESHIGEPRQRYAQDFAAEYGRRGDAEQRAAGQRGQPGQPCRGIARRIGQRRYADGGDAGQQDQRNGDHGGAPHAPGGAPGAKRRGSAKQQQVDAKRSMRAKHDGLFDVSGARRPGNHVHRTRHAAVCRADQRKRLFHPRDHASARTTAMCVSGSSADAVGVSALVVSTSVPVSAMAQNAPVMARRSCPDVGRDSMASPAECQSRSANSGQHTPACDFWIASSGGRSRASRYLATAAGMADRDSTRSTVLAMSVARCMKRATRSAGIAGRGPCA
jgi:hypothetical protein